MCESWVINIIFLDHTIFLKNYSEKYAIILSDIFVEILIFTGKVGELRCQKKHMSLFLALRE